MGGPTFSCYKPPTMATPPAAPMRPRAAAVFAAACLALGCSTAAERAMDEGNRLAAAGSLQQALEAFDRAQGAAPGDWRCAGLRGNVLYAMGRAADARRAWEQSLALAPGEATAAALGLARLEVDQGAPGAALARLDAVDPKVAATPAGETLRAQALLARAAPGDAEQALEAAQRALDRAPADPGALYAAGSAALALHRDSDAQARFAALLQKHPTSPLGPWGMARLAAARGLKSDAVLYLKDARKVAPGPWGPAAVRRDPAFAAWLDDPDFVRETLAP